MENNPQSMQCIPTQSQSDQESSSNVAFVAKITEYSSRMTLNDHHTSHPILYPISFNTFSPSSTFRDNLWPRNNAYF